MTRQERIAQSLTEAFDPIELDVVDDSARHAGHAGASPAGETHFNVRIVAEAFAGKSRVEAQRLVMSALQPEFGTGLHALSIKASAPAPAG